MDRREALKKMAIGGATVVGASAVLSNVAFADGGSRANCRPTPSVTGGLTASLTDGGVAGKKDWVLITPSPATFSVIACPTACGAATASVQYRWDLASSTTSGLHALYTTATGGSPVSGYSAASATSVTAPKVFLRDTNGTNVDNGTFVVRLTVRYICTVGTKKYWSCRAFTLSIVYDPSTGANGTITSQTPGTVGPPDNSSFCDTPAP